MCTAEIIRLIFEGIAAVSVILGAGYYVIDKVTGRSDKTLKAVESLIEEYHKEIAPLGKDVNNEYKTRRKYLGKVERFCIGVESQVYSVRTLKKYGGKFIAKLYNDYRDNLIPKSREQFKDENKYRALEKLARKFGKKA